MIPLPLRLLVVAWVVSAALLVLLVIERDWLMAGIVALVAAFGTIWQLRHRPSDARVEPQSDPESHSQ
jgi:hypothetical protein